MISVEFFWILWQCHLHKYPITGLCCYNRFMIGTDKTRLIVCFMSDLFFTVKVEEAATRLDYQVTYIERAEQIAPNNHLASSKQLAEPLTGPEAVLIDKLTGWQPALIIIDMNIQEVPWRKWLALIKSVPATRRIPVICFGSHIEADTMQDAKNRGAEAVVARSRFSSALAELIEKYARLPDYAALMATCQENLSSLAIQGLEEFNRGEYFEAHESLEDAWNEDQSPGRELYRAILQVAVAYLQVERQNYRGAIKMFLRVRQWISPLPDTCRGVDIARLRVDSQKVYEHLVVLGPNKIAEFDRRLLRPVHYN